MRALGTVGSVRIAASPARVSFLAGVVPNRDGAHISAVVKRQDLRWRFTMITRIVATAIVLILAFGAFWWDAMGVGRILNPFGILFLFIAAIVWFKWDLVRDAFGTANNESGPPINRTWSRGVRLLQRFVIGKSSLRRRS